MPVSSSNKEGPHWSTLLACLNALERTKTTGSAPLLEKVAPPEKKTKPAGVVKHKKACPDAFNLVPACPDAGGAKTITAPLVLLVLTLNQEVDQAPDPILTMTPGESHSSKHGGEWPWGVTPCQPVELSSGETQSILAFLLDLKKKVKDP